MTPDLTDLIRQVRAADAAATPGEWFIDLDGDVSTDAAVIGPADWALVDLLAACLYRTAAPRLAAEVEWQTARAQSAERQVYRLQHGQEIESDYLCSHDMDRLDEINRSQAAEVDARKNRRETLRLLDALGLVDTDDTGRIGHAAEVEHGVDAICSLRQRASEADDAEGDIAQIAVAMSCQPEDAADLVEAVRLLVEERDEAQRNYQFMVDRAADERLDGYRELGARVAAAENERDALRAILDGLAPHLDALRASGLFAPTVNRLLAADKTARDALAKLDGGG